MFFESDQISHLESMNIPSRFPPVIVIFKAEIS